MQPVKFYFDFLNQSSRALYIFMEASKIPFEAIPISMLKGEHLTGEFRDKVNRFKRLPAITDQGFMLSESVAIFRHLNREKLVPEHWYPRRNCGRSRIDEYLEWQQRNMGLACTDYFQQKWLVPYLHKSSAHQNDIHHQQRTEKQQINIAKERLDHALNDFEKLFLNSKQFMIGDNISFADLVAICEIDQPKSIGYDPLNHRVKLARWYEAVQEELGTFYKEVYEQFENQIKNAEKKTPEVAKMILC